MHLRTILSGTLAILLLTGAAVTTHNEASANPLPKLFGGKAEAPVQLAQSGDPRVTALEEQIRVLSGTIEELNFQVLQMQDQIRKMQEDNEFRFQELEQGKSGGTTTNGALDQPVKPHAGLEPPADAGQPAASAAATADADGEQPGNVEEVIILEDRSGNPGVTIPAGTATTGTTGEPPKTFGTITFDDKGNVTGGSVGDQLTVAPATPGQPAGEAQHDGAAESDDTHVAALPSTSDPEELYRNAYEFILSGDYSTAESGFRDHIARFPSDPKTADARYWLGEAQLGQKKYREAAETFLAANKEFPSARKAPDMLLKLGVSLVGLDQRDVACATFAEVTNRYPDISSVLKNRVKQEQALASC